MADIFVSYTSSDQQWAFWIGQELEKLGHAARLFDWEVSAGGDVMAWMEERHDEADRVLCVISSRYLEKERRYSAMERRGALLAAASERPNFLLPVFIEACEAPTLLAALKRCDLYDLSEDQARAGLATFMQPAAKPTAPVPFPGEKKSADSVGISPPQAPVAFPGKSGSRQKERGTISNIPINLPRYFLGRDDDLAAIDKALGNNGGRAAITALHGLRGVGKTTLAAAYAERRRGDYRVTWWIRAETEATTRADLVGLGVRLGSVASDAAEEPALATVLARLQDDGADVLLIYDNASRPDGIRNYLPRGDTVRIIVTSNAPNWGGVAAPVEIEVWPAEIGADYLIARTRRKSERDAALALSEALGGLPLAHEQAAAYCERIGVSLADYLLRFEAAPAKVLGDVRDAPREYHDGLTVAKTFALAIEGAAKMHPTAEPLIVYAALLAPEPIPLFLFSEAREKFGEPFAADIAGDGLDEAVAALRAFALLDRETIPDEREPAISTDCIRLHRLVRQVAAVRQGDLGTNARRVLIGALAKVYPDKVFNNPDSWSRARRLDALALPLVADDAPPPDGAEMSAVLLLNRLAGYRQSALAAHAQARPLVERTLAICEETLGPDHPETAASLNNLGYLLFRSGDFAAAQPHHERALAIREKTLGPSHPDTASSLNNLGSLLQETGDLTGARRCWERALAIREKALGPDHPDTATSVGNLGYLLQEQGDLAGARPLAERALAICEKVLGPNHPGTAISLNNLGSLLRSQGDLAGARPLVERALAISEKTLGSDHPDTAVNFNNLGALLLAQGDPAGARLYHERALAVFVKVLGVVHPMTKTAAGNTATALAVLGCGKEAQALRERFRIE